MRREVSGWDIDGEIQLLADYDLVDAKDFEQMARGDWDYADEGAVKLRLGGGYEGYYPLVAYAEDKGLSLSRVIVDLDFSCF